MHLHVCEYIQNTVKKFDNIDGVVGFSNCMTIYNLI